MAQLASDVSNPDAGLHVEIYSEPVELTFQSKQAGHPVFEDRDFIRIMNPGDSLNIVVREITDADKQRFPRHWALYQTMGHTDSQPGYAIEQWPAISRAVGKTLKGMGFHTVEQIAAASDQNISRLGMAVGMTPTTFREKAKAFLAAAAGTANIERQAAENADLRQRVKDLEDALARGGVQLPVKAPRKKKDQAAEPA